ncbi:hypothetical protein PR048_018349 [Dryococelus australis]|uniref:C2H2-type domain-containing protein n=1 Tax=Dryococelus australis TaxID=614101 RepID=A0ABQ9HC22_9NEOP|nr:hypothetical protein PR048_018349 [Dryococelus australis]
MPPVGISWHNGGRLLLHCVLEPSLGLDTFLYTLLRIMRTSQAKCSDASSIPERKTIIDSIKVEAAQSPGSVVYCRRPYLILAPATRERVCVCVCADLKFFRLWQPLGCEPNGLDHKTTAAAKKSSTANSHNASSGMHLTRPMLHDQLASRESIRQPRWSVDSVGTVQVSPSRRDDIPSVKVARRHEKGECSKKLTSRIRTCDMCDEIFGRSDNLKTHAGTFENQDITASREGENENAVSKIAGDVKNKRKRKYSANDEVTTSAKKRRKHVAEDNVYLKLEQKKQGFEPSSMAQWSRTTYSSSNIHAEIYPLLAVARKDPTSNNLVSFECRLRKADMLDCWYFTQGIPTCHSRTRFLIGCLRVRVTAIRHNVPSWSVLYPTKSQRCRYETWCHCLYQMRFLRGRGGVVDRALAFCQREPGSLVSGFSRGLPFLPALHFDDAPYQPRFTLIDCQDLDVKIRPNVSTSLQCFLVKDGYSRLHSTREAIICPLSTATATTILARINIGCIRLTLIQALHLLRSLFRGGSYSLTLGSNSMVLGSYSLALDSYNLTLGSYSLVLGSYSLILGSYSMAYGSYSMAYGSYSLALGSYSLVLGSCSLVLDSYSLVLGSCSLVLGSYGLVLGRYSLIIGSYSLVLGSYSLVLGSYSLILDSCRLVLGSYNWDLGSYSLSLCSYSHDLGCYSLPLGSYSLTLGIYSLVLCSYSLVLDSYSLVLGSCSLVLGSYILVLGSYILVIGKYSLVICSYNQVLGSYSLVLGSYSLALGSYSLVLRSYSLVLGSYSLVLGSYILVLGSYSLVLSCYSLVLVLGNMRYDSDFRLAATSAPTYFHSWKTYTLTYNGSTPRKPTGQRQCLPSFPRVKINLSPTWDVRVLNGGPSLAPARRKMKVAYERFVSYHHLVDATFKLADLRYSPPSIHEELETNVV